MKLFAVAGNPILHSLSPQVFAWLFQRFRVNALYRRLHAGSAAEALHLFAALGLDGLNITAPLKVEMASILEDLDDAAATTGAVNTVIRRNGRLVGCNTDPQGVVGPLRARKISLAGKRCLVLGAGGAGRSAIYALIRSGCQVTVINRHLEKARACVSALGGRAKPVAHLPRCLERAEIVVNTVPCVDEILPAAWVPGRQVVLDAVYGNPRLKSLSMQRETVYIPGEEWLWHQAWAAFCLFLQRRRGPPALLPESALASQPGSVANLALIGFMGSGKSTVGRILARRLGCGFADSDRLIERAEALTVREIFIHRGERHFRHSEGKVLHGLLSGEGRVIACGGGSVIRSGNREGLRRRATVVWLSVSPPEALQRLRRSNRPLLDVADRHRAAGRIFRKRKRTYFQCADLIVDGEKRAEEAATAIADEWETMKRRKTT